MRNDGKTGFLIKPSKTFLKQQLFLSVLEVASIHAEASLPAMYHPMVKQTCSLINPFPDFVSFLEVTKSEIKVRKIQCLMRTHFLHYNLVSYEKQQCNILYILP